MKYFIFFFIFTLLSNNLKSNNNNEVIVEIGNEKVTFAELKRAYEKNLAPNEKGLIDKDKKEFERFLNLYVDYKLKVIDAKDKGFLKDPEVLKEIETNRQMIAKSYFLDREFEEPRLKEILEKRKNEFRFAYIIIPYQNDSASGSARGTAYTALERINKGEKFGDIAKIYSKDLKSSENGGEVNSWVTGGQLQIQLEEPLMTLKVGEVYPKVIETNYGYFIVKLIDRVDRKFYKAGHLLIQFAGPTAKDTSDAYDKIKKIQNELKSGKNFEELTKIYSDDFSTKDSGGVFTYWYNRATGFTNNGSPLVKQFEDALIPLKNNEVSDIVKSEYGLHLIKKYDTKDVDLHDELKIVKEMFKKVFYTKELKIFNDSLAKSFGYVLFDNVRDEFQKYLDTTKTNLGTAWADSVPTEIYSKKLFSFNKKFYTIEDFINASKTDKNLKGFLLSNEGFDLATLRMIEDEVFRLATANLEVKYPEFKLLSEEFQNGSILFKAEEIEVWQKNKLDSNIAKNYYNENKNNYMTNWQYDIYEIFQFSEKNIKTSLQKLNDGENFEILASLDTQREGFREKNGYRGIIDAGKDPLAKKINPDEIKINQIYGPIELDRGFSIVKCVAKFPPRVMTFEEAFPMISPKALEISQNNLKKEWLERVKTKHKVKINTNIINQIYK